MDEHELGNAADAVWEDLRAAMAVPGADRPAMIAACLAFAVDLAVAEYGVERAQARLSAEFEAARLVRDFEKRAAEDGVQVTAEQRAEIEALAQQYVTLTLAVHDQTAAQERLNREERAALDQAEARGNAIEDLGDRFSGIIQRADSLSDALRNVAIELTNLVAQAIAGQGPLAALFGGGGSGPGGGFLGDLFGSLLGGGGGSGGSLDSTLGIRTNERLPGLSFHKGGVVGRDGTPRQMPAALFADAPRLHSGGIIGPNEVPPFWRRARSSCRRTSAARGKRPLLMRASL